MRTEDYDREIRRLEEQAADWQQRTAGFDRATDGTEWQLNMAQWHANKAADLRDRRAIHVSEEATEAREWFETNCGDRADQAFALWQQHADASAQGEGRAR